MTRMLTATATASAAAALLLSLTACGGEASESTKEVAAKVKCHSAIMREVLDTDYDDFSDTRVTKFGDAWKVSGSVTGRNAFGGPVQQRFVCTVEWDSDANDAKVIATDLL